LCSGISQATLVTVTMVAGADVADHWLDTGGRPATATGPRTYPKRSELRRAEARRSSHRGPADGRPANAPSGGQRPSFQPPRAPRTPVAGVAVRPTPAVLPIPQADQWRPAGIDLPMPAPVSEDPFRRPEVWAPMVPIAVPAARPLIGAGPGGAARLLVMALIVGAQGVGASYLATHAGPLFGDGGSAALSSAFVLDPEAQQAQQAQAAEAAVAVELHQAQREASPAKAKAAYSQAKMAAARIKAAQERRDAALRNAQRDPRGAARLLVADRGWSSSEFSCLDSLWTKESNWNYRATNPSSGAYGIPQSLPGSKMAANGSDWATNPVTQIQWGLDYIAGRYGTPCGAWNFSQIHNSY
jgi:hypothetical protein